MIKRIIYILMVFFTIVACEEIYKPDLEEVDDLLVVEAVLISNQTENDIYLYKTINFNREDNSYPSVSGAQVYLVDANNNQVKCEETAPGAYKLNYQLDANGSYYLYIEYAGERYQSGLQTVPELPHIDSVYTDFITKSVVVGASNSTDKITEVRGVQIYADMKHKGGVNHYRFYARKIVQYITYFDSIVLPSLFPQEFSDFHWSSFYPKGTYNIAGPQEFSTEKDITMHELDFFESDYSKYKPLDGLFAGWIYIVYQYGISEDAYNFYSDLNSQLDAEGKIFDPVYTQTKGNIQCVTDPEKVVLGNFEISSFSEKRFFLDYNKFKDTVRTLESIPFFYDIPERGHRKITKPDFWIPNFNNKTNE
ncbi:DUF4249 domain-containing protein [Maribellus maritimus]|uniref:DUF4249 domain-containing protein n=1 Tax=Maribellus maritimus TaxID=2870838 RepID=UPI001EEC0986|nr:DUF4249 domain-containing protein [Maribellus maritimus]MCG6186049.1 DUF4249 domain-containing protein [Maribellus maritimus]